MKSGSKLNKFLKIIREIQSLTKDTRQPYHSRLRTVKWNEKLSDELRDAMFKESEVLILLDPKGKQHSFFFVDESGTIRQRTLASL